ncbi:uncharacterized protein KY384_004203 [Bacidia gigantensis]|uniref:uncharacterized protein n=1 Tax=Bacidia gigantensis TaxID=2732470 RepID=UPI001D03885A|nr:uncharacterized protein KY384_004203 [Bacidia gigantensis]KAG8530846.1 hypothetical protein KY384_004203 [Bacidia gigantensis]
MAVVAASPTPFAASYNVPLREQFPRHPFNRPGSRPNLKRGLPLASSINNPPLQQPWNFSMGDSSDDEVPVPPMKFSAEAKAILGDEASVIGSSPSQKRDDSRGYMRLDPPRKKVSPLAVSQRFQERSGLQSSLRNGSPRIVRLNASSPNSSTLKRTTSLFNGTSPKAKEHDDFVTPGPRCKSAQSGSANFGSHISSEGQKTEYQSSAESQWQPDPTTTSKEHSSIHDAEGQMGNLSVSRNRVDDTGAHTGQRQKRVQVTGKFLRGPARRGMKRRQSEEDQSPNHEAIQSPSDGKQQQGEFHEPDVEPRMPASAIERNPRHQETDKEDQSRPPHVRFQSQASIITGSPEQKRHEPAKAPLNETGVVKPVVTSSSKDAHPTYKLPPPSIPSRYDQENEPPPTFRRNKLITARAIENGKIMVAQDEKMLIQTPATISPSRPALAVRSQNTPHRPAPPPPKMSVVETATAGAGAVTASTTKKKRNFISVNGRMFTRMDCIGRGGSSRVYRVMAENYKIFALKRVSLDEQAESAVQGYKGEIDLLRRLENVDRVVRLYDYEVNEEKKHLSVLMEMGESDLNRVLTHRLEEGVLDLTSTRYFWREMLQCVAAVHALQIVHSDLKPANFLLLQGQLKLIDFGISNAIAENTVNVHREQQIGTPNYMSPEALRATADGQTLKLGKPSDVWSLGCILYQMVHGKPPFAHIPNQIQRIAAIPNERHAISFPEAGLGGVPVPSGLMRTLKRCLNRDIKQRPTVEELLELNDSFLHPDRVLESTVPMGRELIERMQHNIIRHIKEKGMPSEDELRSWPDRFYRSIKAAVEEGKA